MVNCKPTSLTQDELKGLLNYDPDTGIFSWLRTASATAVGGAIAGSINSHGYRCIRINHRAYQAHVLAWIYMYGEWPAETIDHINRDRADNRIINLRLANHAQQVANTGLSRRNTTGFRGVGREGRKFSASVRVNNKVINLGYYHHPRYAAAIAALARIEHFGKHAIQY